MRRAGMVFAASLLAVLGVSACGDDGGNEAGKAETVKVTLSEWLLKPERATVRAGEVEFVAENVGGGKHELEVVAAASVQSLPTDDKGAAQVEKDKEMGEIEDIAAGATKRATFDLKPGSYVLICNIVEEEEGGTIESHFDKGMHALFTVT